MPYSRLGNHFFLAALLLCLLVGLLPGQASSAASGTANSANNGLAAASSDGTLYYLDLTGDIYAGGQENIYRLTPGAASPLLICADEAWNLVISGKYLYYSNWSDQHTLYRINLDNNEKTKISSQPAGYLTANDNVLVYTSRNSSGSENGIYKLVLADPAAPQKLVDDQAENLTVAGDWVYYLNASDSYRLYKIKLNGSDRRKLTEDQVSFMAIADTTIYYSNASDKQQLYTISTDGQHRTKLLDDKTGFINVSGSQIYYTNSSANHALYCYNTNDHSKQLICDLGIGPQPIVLVDKWIYYNRLFIKR